MVWTQRAQKRSHSPKFEIANVTLSKNNFQKKCTVESPKKLKTDKLKNEIFSTTVHIKWRSTINDVIMHTNWVDWLLALQYLCCQRHCVCNPRFSREYSHSYYCYCCSHLDALIWKPSNDPRRRSPLYKSSVASSSLCRVASRRGYKSSGHSSGS